jgi:hypothetical protein
MCNLAQKLANVEGVNYAVYINNDTSYNFIQESLITNQQVLFKAIPNDCTITN